MNSDDEIYRNQLKEEITKVGLGSQSDRLCNSLIWWETGLGCNAYGTN